VGRKEGEGERILGSAKKEKGGGKGVVIHVELSRLAVVGWMEKKSESVKKVQDRKGGDEGKTGKEKITISSKTKKRGPELCFHEDSYCFWEGRSDLQENDQTLRIIPIASKQRETPARNFFFETELGAWGGGGKEKRKMWASMRKRAKTPSNHTQFNMKSWEDRKKNHLKT